MKSNGNKKSVWAERAIIKRFSGKNIGNVLQRNEKGNYQMLRGAIR